VGGKIEGLGFGRSIKIGLWMGKDSAWMEKEKNALIDEAKPDQVIEGSKHRDLHDLFDISDRQHLANFTLQSKIMVRSDFHSECVIFFTTKLRYLSCPFHR
jgi:hypothetical protein